MTPSPGKIATNITKEVSGSLHPQNGAIFIQGIISMFLVREKKKSKTSTLSPMDFFRISECILHPTS